MDLKNIEYVVPCLFGLESTVRDELKDMGEDVTEVRDGRVTFRGDLASLAKASLRLRCGERILIRLSTFQVYSFEDLYQGVKAIPWEDIIGSKDAFPVTGHCLRSQLASVPDCQKIMKKAVVDRLSDAYGLKWFPETGIKYALSFLIMKDSAEIMLDTSGEGLHKRGYREQGSEAPLKETLAAAIVKTSRYRGRDVFVDFMCGSGTIPIEAAMIAQNIAPGLHRTFAFEGFSFFKKTILQDERQAALDLIEHKDIRILASDIDPEMTNLTKHNARLAGVDKYITVSTADMRNFSSQEQYGTIVCNPPYGERLMGKDETAQLYRDMGRVTSKLPQWRFYIITADEYFERCFGRPADKKRKLYNGMIKCDLYQYYKIK
ncbi:MAG: class I SAM-dependent RNA methyltransferase [Bacillota bacterium]|nr:class I SAM-dependent RNA methyltransferase [Bacillota bacterium]